MYGVFNPGVRVEDLGELAVKATATLKSTSLDYPFESNDEDMKKGDRILVAVIAVLILDYFDVRPIMDYYQVTLLGWALLILIQGSLCFFLIVCAQEAVQAIAQMRFDWKHRNEVTRDSAYIVRR